MKSLEIIQAEYYRAMMCLLIYKIHKTTSCFRLLLKDVPTWSPCCLILLMGVAVVMIVVVVVVVEASNASSCGLAITLLRLV